MTYRILLTLPCGTRHTVLSLSEASLLITVGWQLVSLRGRRMASSAAG